MSPRAYFQGYRARHHRGPRKQNEKDCWVRPKSIKPSQVQGTTCPHLYLEVECFWLWRFH